MFAVLASLLYPAPAGADSSICSTGDLDGDGVADFVLASRDTRGPETVWAFSGRDGKAIWGVQTDVVGDGFGSAMACVPDVDDDGAAEVLIASPGESLTGESPDQEWRRVRTGRVRLFSGRSGSVLLELSADELFGAFGASVGTCGDLDGDRMPELLVGCPGARPGRVRAYSAKSGLEIREWVAPAHAGGTEAFGDAVCEITDFDADGVPDVLVGDSLAVKPGSKRQGRGRGRGTKDDWLIAEDENPTGCVRLFSGATGALLRTVWNDNSRDTGGRTKFGHMLEHVGDVDGDGCPDVCVWSEGPVLRILSSRSLNDLIRIPCHPEISLGGSSVAWIEKPDHSVLAIAASGQVDLRSGADGSQWNSVHASMVNVADVGCPGDLDADGIPDLVLSIVGPFWPRRGGPRSQQVRAWSTRAMSPLYDVYGDSLRALNVRRLGE